MRPWVNWPWYWLVWPKCWLVFAVESGNRVRVDMKQVTNNSMLKNTLLNTGKSFFHGDEGAYIYLSGFDMFCVFRLGRWSHLGITKLLAGLLKVADQHLFISWCLGSRILRTITSDCVVPRLDSFQIAYAWNFNKSIWVVRCNLSQILKFPDNSMAAFSSVSAKLTFMARQSFFAIIQCRHSYLSKISLAPTSSVKSTDSQYQAILDKIFLIQRPPISSYTPFLRT